MDKLEFNTYPKQLKFNADEGKLLPVGDQNIEYNSAAKIGEGTDGIIFRIVTHFQNEYSEKLRGFVYKIFRDPKEKDDSVRIFNYLKSLHNPHIHIPPTYRATENGTLMTDLTDNGKNLVLSANDISTEEQIAALIKELSHHPAFSKLIPQLDLDKFEREAMELADELARNGVRVARDSFFLILNQEGKFELMPVDFGYMEVEINNPDYHINFDEHNPQYDDYFNIVSRDRGGTKMFVETLTVFFKRFEKEKVGNN